MTMKKLLLMLLLFNVGYYFLIMDRTDSSGGAEIITRGAQNIPLLVRVNELGEAPLSASIVPLGFEDSTLELARKSAAVVAANHSLSSAQDEVADVGVIAETESEAVAVIGVSDDASATGSEKKSNLADVTQTIEKPGGGGRLPECFTLGPFKDEAVSIKVSSRLEKAGSVVQSRIRTKKISGAWWVYLPPYESRELAIEASKVLAGNDVKDYFIIASDAEMANGISLGLFSKKEGSQRRIERIELLGFQPKVLRREREISTYWLDVTTSNSLDEKFWKISEVANYTEVKPRECAP